MLRRREVKRKVKQEVDWIPHKLATLFLQVIAYFVLIQVAISFANGCIDTRVNKTCKMRIEDHDKSEMIIDAQTLYKIKHYTAIRSPNFFINRKEMPGY